MAHNYIMQWNIRGLRRNIEDIELLISKYSPAAICLQETMLKRDQIQTFKHYSAYYKNSINGHDGVCILVKNNFIHNQVQFQADLQAVAVCITIIKHILWLRYMFLPMELSMNWHLIEWSKVFHLVIWYEEILMAIVIYGELIKRMNVVRLFNT